MIGSWVNRGFSIVELLIGLALSSLVVLCVTHLLLVSQQHALFQQQQHAMYNDGQFALNFLAKVLRRAGFSLTDTELVPVVFAQHSGTVVNGAWVETLYSRDSGPFDELVLAVDGALDCAGAETTKGLLRLYVSREALRCATYEANTGFFRPDDQGLLVPGVKAFQVMYGLDTNMAGEAGFGSVNNYVTASNYNAHLGRVLSVRFALLLEGGGAMPWALEPTPTQLELLGQSFSVGANPGAVNLREHHLVKQFTTTVTLPNVARLYQ